MSSTMRAGGPAGRGRTTRSTLRRLRDGAGSWARLVLLVLAATYAATVVLLAAWVLVPSAVLGLQPVVVQSGSMSPTIRVGDVVLLDPRGGDGPGAIGSVVTFEALDGRLVTHRVVGIAPDGALRTRGDANEDLDAAPVPPSAVRGTGRLVVPAAGLPGTWLRSAPALALLWGVLTAGAGAVLVLVRPPSAPPAPAPVVDDADRWSWPVRA